MAAIWVCFTEGRTPCPTLAAFCQYLGSPRDGGGRAEGNEEKGKGAIPFLEASWGLPCIHGRGVVGDNQFLPS